MHLTLEGLEDRRMMTATVDSPTHNWETGRSLRGAIIEANNKPGPDVIVLTADTYELSIKCPSGQPDNEKCGDLDITDDLTIKAVGSERITIDANRIDRVFDVHEASLVLERIRITGGGGYGV